MVLNTKLSENVSTCVQTCSGSNVFWENMPEVTNVYKVLDRLKNTCDRSIRSDKNLIITIIWKMTQCLSFTSIWEETGWIWSNIEWGWMQGWVQLHNCDWLKQNVIIIVTEYSKMLQLQM